MHKTDPGVMEAFAPFGTDAGLLREPVALPSGGPVLASAELADLIVDFSDLQPGTELTLFNTARAPYDGAPFPAVDAADAADLDGLLPYPHVMRFRLVPGPARPGPARHRPVPRELSADLAPPTPEELDEAPRRAIALVERELEDAPNMLTMRELAIVDDGETPGPLITRH